jgi:acyl-[acyl carrier protein]--UDP-N-acetylglucosamine O-acyltransferase
VTQALIFGTGTFSRQLADEMLASRRADSVIGFVADGDSEERSLDGLPVLPLERAEALWSRSSVELLVGAPAGASPMPITGWRRAAFHGLRGRGARIGGFVHPNARIFPGAVLHPSAIVLARAYIESLARIGRNVVMECDSYVTQACSVGAHSYLGPSSLVAGQVVLHAEVWLDTNATLRSGLTICRGARVAAGAVVQQDLYPFQEVSARAPRLSDPHGTAP